MTMRPDGTTTTRPRTPGRTRAAAASGVLLALLGAPAAAQTTPPAPARWAAIRWNPAPAEGDLVLPIPCGGSIVFREIPVPGGDGPLDDRRIFLGTPDTRDPHAEFQRPGFVAGGFAAGAGVRRYWMGKYEVTRDQYAAVMTPESCPAATPDGRRPRTDISWLEAMTFSERLTTFLVTNARAALPSQDGTPAHVRLPSEEEWEYAARGGAAVSEAEFSAPAFPMPDGADAYVMGGAQRSGNRPQAIGGLRPNPLGLHDILGNVAEFVLEPFRLNRVGRDHGGMGGLVVRGGSVARAPDDARSSERTEIPPFEPGTGRPTRLPQVGFRVALGVTATTTLPQVERLREAFAREAGARETDARSAAEDPRRALELLRAGQSDPALQAALRRVEAQLASDQRERDDRQREALRAQIEFLHALAYSAFTLETFTEQARGMLASASPEERRGLGAELGYLESVVAGRTRSWGAMYDSYFAVLRRISEGSPRIMALEAQATVRRELTDRRLTGLANFAEPVERHLIAAFAGQVPSPQAIRTAVRARGEDAAREERRAATDRR